jgi:hypothetical protein
LKTIENVEEVDICLDVQVHVKETGQVEGPQDVAAL